MAFTKEILGYFNSHPYFFYGMGAMFLLIFESGIEIENSLNAVVNNSILFSMGISSNLPGYFTIVAAIYDLLITILPFKMFQDVNNSNRWGYLTATFGAGGQYLNINIMPGVTGILFIVLLLAGIVPVLLTRTKSGENIAKRSY